MEKDRLNFHLEQAKGRFSHFIKNINKIESQWIQYVGFEIIKGRLYFKFESSQNSLSFMVEAGCLISDLDNSEFTLFNHASEIYDYFRTVKYLILDK
jgi:hypothetical protein